MKGNKIESTLLIAVLLISAIAGLVAIPVAKASTPIAAKYTLEAGGDGKATWTTDEKYRGSYSVELVQPAEADYAEIQIPVNIKLSALDLTKTSFWCKSTDGDWIPYFIFELETGDRINHDAASSTGYSDWAKYSLPPLVDVWQWTDSEGDPVGGFDHKWVDTITEYGDLTVTTVLVELSGITGPITAYVDDITINGIAYKLEPQSLTAGQSYDITWATGYGGEDIHLLYEPEGLPDIDITSTASSSGVVNFYNVVPHYAGNWTLSDLTNLPTPVYNETGLVMMSVSSAATYFLVQPAKDLTVSVSPSALDVKSGTKALTVTVTSGGSPVGGAYVCVEFWDNEATHLDTPDTALLRKSTIKTASNGVAIFDVEVPKVAGTIFLMAGTDLGPETLAEIDGQYFEHWGSKTIPVSAKSAIDITVSPTSYSQGVPYDLEIDLKNSGTLNVLGACTEDYSVNVTLTGEDFEGTIDFSALVKFTVDEVIAIKDGHPTKTTNPDDDVIIVPGTDSLKISGKCPGFGPTDIAKIIISDFKSTKIGDVIVRASTDIGGVEASAIKSLSSPGAPDQLFDYIDTGAKTISVSKPDEISFVGLTPDKIPACTDKTVTFTAYYYDGTSTQLAKGFDVVLSYPTGRTYAGKTDADTGVFTVSLTLASEPYWADEAGTMTITVSGTVEEDEETVTYSGSKTMPVTGYLVSTDTETIVVKTKNTITITVTNATTSSVINNAKVSMTPSAGTLTGVVLIDGAVTSINNGQYVFHNVNASQVCTIKVLVEKVTTKMARLFIEASNPVLTITSTKDKLTNIVDNEFTLRVMHGATPEDEAEIFMNDISIGKTNSTGYLDVTIDYTDMDVDTDSLRFYTVSYDKARTGELILPVDLPIYVPSKEFYLTAGINSVGNFTIKSADGAVILIDSAASDNKAKVRAFANMTVSAMNPSGTWEDIAAGTLLRVKAGYLAFKLKAATSCDTTFVKINALKFTAKTASATPLSVVVATIPIHNPIVSNTTYTGFPITYTAYVGQSKNLYVKIQDASGAPVKDATILIVGTTAEGVTNAAGETTITWTPPSTGTYKLRLNGELDIGAITVKSYVVPQLVINYSPETAHKNDDITLTVTAEGAVGGASVTVVDPDGKTISKTTTATGTCKFTADKVGEWTVYASKAGYTDADPVAITVLERVPVAEYDIALSAGWNLISLPLIPENSTIEAVLTDLDGVEAVWSYEAGTWYSYAPDVPSDLTEMTDGKGYWIEMSASATLTVYGTEMPEDPLAPLPAYPVVVGWNLVGFKETYTMRVSDYLAGVSYARVYEYVGGYHSLSASDLMKPGQGYWIAVTEAGTIYP